MKRRNWVDRESRRNALKGMAVLGGAVALSATTNASAAADGAPEWQEKAPESLGYRETEHVREYYRRARF